jgi:hypothetical protein
LGDHPGREQVLERHPMMRASFPTARTRSTIRSPKATPPRLE